ncbi:MAG: hypothetical protein MUD02_05000 [Bacteroidales bacterium]|nr:hypothetical protein [Bacteroidales bacterium]MCU0408289.1 hypothetical protein [Bacteroidales bacterium]
MKYLIYTLSVIILIFITDCGEEKLTAADFRTSQIIGFDTEKCFCCWGWIIKVGTDTIKADYIPGLKITENTVFPIDARISIGNRTTDCSGYMFDYFEIKEFIEIK